MRYPNNSSDQSNLLKYKRSQKEMFPFEWKSRVEICVKKCYLSSSQCFYFNWFIHIILLIFIIFIHFISTCQVQSTLTATHLTIFRYNFFTFVMLALISYMCNYWTQDILVESIPQITWVTLSMNSCKIAVSFGHWPWSKAHYFIST